MSLRRLILVGAAVLAADARMPEPNATPTTRFVEVEPGVRIEVLDWGGTGRPVVLLAGYGRTAHDFATFGDSLAATYHVYAITRRGFGASSKPASGYSADRLGDDVLAVIDSLGLVAPVLAGHSLGGEELSSIGSRHPRRVSGLVYLDAAYGYAFYDEADTENRFFIDLNEVTRGLQQLTGALETGHAEDAHRLIRRLRSVDLQALDETLQRLDQRVPAVSANPPQSFTMRLAPGVDRMVFEGLQRYTSVSAPVLAIYALKGTKDSTAIKAWRSGTRHEVVALKRAAPNARVLILPDASHDVFRSHASDVLRAMRSFIAALPKS